MEAMQTSYSIDRALAIAQAMVSGPFQAAVIAENATSYVIEAASTERAKAYMARQGGAENRHGVIKAVIFA
jgi:hypothetical protein